LDWKRTSKKAKYGWSFGHAFAVSGGFFFVNAEGAYCRKAKQAVRWVRDPNSKERWMVRYIYIFLLSTKTVTSLTFTKRCELGICVTKVYLPAITQSA